MLLVINFPHTGCCSRTNCLPLPEYFVELKTSACIVGKMLSSESRGWTWVQGHFFIERFTFGQMFLGHSHKEIYVVGSMGKSYIFATSRRLAVGCPL